jgi:hypothetical protein
MTFRVLGGVVTQRISDRRVRSKCPYQKLSIHFLVSLVAILIFCLSHVAIYAQSPSAMTVDITIACPKEEDFSRYNTLLLDHVSAAIMFKNDHDCVTLATGTFVRVDKGSVQRNFNHVCIRPVGSYDCLWTFAAHIKVE